MKVLFLSLAMLTLTMPCMALAMAGNTVLGDLIRSGSSIHPHGILACK